MSGCDYIPLSPISGMCDIPLQENVQIVMFNYIEGLSDKLLT